MSLYLVRDPDTEQAVWLAWVDTASVRVYSWIPNLDRFVMNSGLAQDFYRENEMRYEVVDDASAARPLQQRSARSTCAAAAGWSTSSPKARSPAPPTKWWPPPFSQLGPVCVNKAAAIAGRVKDAAPGEWVSWKTYPAERKQLAYVAANDLRKGRVRALVTQAGGVDSRVLPAGDGTLLVQVSRIAGLTAQTRRH